MTSPLPKLQTFQLASHQASINCLALGGFGTPHHHTIASGGNDNETMLWDSRIFQSPDPSLLQSRSYSTPIGHISTSSSVNSVVFGELSLPYTTERPIRTISTHPTTPPSQSTPHLAFSQELFQTNANALFCATNNIVLQFDLRKLSLSTPLSQHVAICSGFNDCVGFLTLSPDGKQIAICTDDNSIHFAPLTSLPLSTSTAVQSEIIKFSPHTTLNKHENIPTGIQFDPLCPIRLVTASQLPISPPADSSTTLSTPQDQPTQPDPLNYFQSFTTYSTGMDMNILQSGLPAAVEPFRTSLSHPYAQQSSTNVNEQGMSGQISNPPFINASTISPNSTTLLSALGDGNFSVHALEREVLLPRDIFSTFEVAKSQYAQSTPLQQSLLYIDALTSLFTSTRSYAPFKSHPPTYLGSYRGHMHSVVGICIPNFLQSHIDSLLTTRLWLSNLAQQTLYRNYNSQLPNPTAAKPSFYQTLGLGAETNALYTQTEQETVSSILRHNISQQYSLQRGEILGKANGKPLYDFNRTFDDIRHILTCSLDQSLVLWKPSVAEQASTVYNVARSKTYQTPQQATAPNARNQKNNTKGQKVAPQSHNQPQQHKINYVKILESILTADDATGAEIKRKIENLAQEKQDRDYFNQIDEYERQLMQARRADRGASGHDLISGMYKKLGSENSILESDFIQLRVPLASKPNAMVTDRIGNVYIVDTTKKITVIHLLKE